MGAGLEGSLPTAQPRLEKWVLVRLCLVRHLPCPLGICVPGSDLWASHKGREFYRHGLFS